MNELAGNVISVHCGIFVSFILNRNYNFKKTDKTFKRAISFYIVGLCGLALSSLILMLGTSLKFEILYVKIFSVFFVALVQFIFNNFITFKK